MPRVAPKEDRALSSLPDPETLAKLVSNVTKTMFAVSFVPAEATERGESVCFRMVLMTIAGPRKIHIVLSSDREGSAALAANLFGCSAKDLDRQMVDDAIAELLNMVAGQLVPAMRLDQAIGLPRLTTLAEFSALGGPGLSDTVLLRSDSNLHLRLWIFEEHQAPAESVPKSRTGRFRSLIGRGEKSDPS